MIMQLLSHTQADAVSIETLSEKMRVSVFQVERVIYTAIREERKAIVIDENNCVYISNNPEEVRRAAERLQLKAQNTGVKLARDNLFEVAKTLLEIAEELETTALRSVI